MCEGQSQCKASFLNRSQQQLYRAHQEVSASREGDTCRYCMQQCSNSALSIAQSIRHHTAVVVRSTLLCCCNIVSQQPQQQQQQRRSCPTKFNTNIIIEKPNAARKGRPFRRCIHHGGSTAATGGRRARGTLLWLELGLHPRASACRCKHGTSGRDRPDALACCHPRREHCGNRHPDRSGVCVVRLYNYFVI